MNLRSFFKEKWINILLVILAILLAYLAYLKPVFIFSFMEIKDINVSSSKVNLETNGEIFVLQNLSLVEFENDEIYTGNNYKYNAKDFVEGENKVRIYREINFYFFKFRSENWVDIKIEVDRIPPKLALVENYPQFVVSGYVPLHFVSEPNVLVFKDGEDIGQKGNTIDIGVDFVSKYIKVRLNKDSNDFQLTVVDTFGNESKSLSIIAEDFDTKDYVIVALNSDYETILPLREYQVFSSEENEDLPKYEPIPRLDIATHNCENQCNYILDTMSFGSSWTNDLDEVLEHLKSKYLSYSTEVYVEERVVTLNGYKATHISVNKYYPEYGYQYIEAYLIEYKDNLYSFSFNIPATSLDEIKAKWSDDLQVAVEHLVFMRYD